MLTGDGRGEREVGHVDAPEPDGELGQHTVVVAHHAEDEVAPGKDVCHIEPRAIAFVEDLGIRVEEDVPISGVRAHRMASAASQIGKERDRVGRLANQQLLVDEPLVGRASSEIARAHARHESGHRW